MTASGSFEDKKKKCKFRRTKREENAKTSSSGRFYDYCSFCGKICEKATCVLRTGGDRSGH